jgi:hypothetical protein
MIEAHQQFKTPAKDYDEAALLLTQVLKQSGVFEADLSTALSRGALFADYII